MTEQEHNTSEAFRKWRDSGEWAEAMDCAAHIAEVAFAAGAMTAPHAIPVDADEPQGGATERDWLRFLAEHPGSKTPADDFIAIWWMGRLSSAPGTDPMPATWEVTP